MVTLFERGGVQSISPSLLLLGAVILRGRCGLIVVWIWNLGVVVGNRYRSGGRELGGGNIRQGRGKVCLSWSFAFFLEHFGAQFTHPEINASSSLHARRTEESRPSPWREGDHHLPSCSVGAVVSHICPLIATQTRSVQSRSRHDDNHHQILAAYPPLLTCGRIILVQRYFHSWEVYLRRLSYRYLKSTTQKSHLLRLEVLYTKLYLYNKAFAVVSDRGGYDDVYYEDRCSIHGVHLI